MFQKNVTIPQRCFLIKKKDGKYYVLIQVIKNKPDGSSDVMDSKIRSFKTEQKARNYYNSIKDDSGSFEGEVLDDENPQTRVFIAKDQKGMFIIFIQFRLNELPNGDKNIQWNESILPQLFNTKEDAEDWYNGSIMI